MFERYEPLVGYEKRKTKRGPLNMLSGKLSKRGFFWNKNEDKTEIEKIFSVAERKGSKKSGGNSLRPSYEGHKYFFAINLC